MRTGKDHVGIGVGVVITNDKGEIVLTERANTANNRIGEWELPGGTVEFGDTLEETIVREVCEETGLIVKPLYCVSVHQDFVEGQHWVSFGYVAKLIEGELQNREPHKFSQVKFCDPKDLPYRTSELTEEVVKNYLSNKKISVSKLIK